MELTRRIMLFNKDVVVVIRDVDGDKFDVSGDAEHVFLNFLNDDGTEGAYRTLNTNNVETLINALEAFRSNLSGD